MAGFDFALSEISLVIFTALAPSGAVALLLLCGYLLRCKLQPADCQHICQYGAIPIAITLIGLVASASHLGNPANALYVVMGFGRSPLSNEVVAACAFLGFAATGWLYSFARNPKPLVGKMLMVLVIVTGMIFLLGVSSAYSIDTIPTWFSWHVPVGLWLSALVGGPFLLLLTLDAAGYAEHFDTHRRTFCLVSLAALVAHLVVLLLQDAEMASIRNSLFSVSDLVGSYAAFAAAYFILAIIGASIIWFRPAVVHAGGRWETLSRDIVACVAVFAGIIVIRFSFYLVHMTVGLPSM